MRNRGFIIIAMLFLLLLLSITAIAVNGRTGLQARMAFNQHRTIQTYLDQLAVIEQSVWKLTGDVCWRTSGEAYSYNGTAYTRMMLDAAQAGYGDAVAVSVFAPNAEQSLRMTLRHYLDTAFQTRSPRQICADSAGNIYFADSINHSVWKIDAAMSSITRVVGVGTSGAGGDGGAAAQAQLNAPESVATDVLGNLYIADTGNSRIRRVDPLGRISTYAGTGTAGYSGDSGLAISASLNTPKGVFADSSGNLYIADTGNCMIRKVDVASKIITRIAGKTEGGLPSCGAAIDNVPAGEDRFLAPRGIYRAASGTIYVADTGNDRIRKFTEGGNTTTFAGGGASWLDNIPATTARMTAPQGISGDAAGNIYLADTASHWIRMVDAAGMISTAAGINLTAGYSGDGGPATAAQVDSPAGICALGSGNLVIADTGNSTLRRVDRATGIISTLPMIAVPSLNTPNHVAAYYAIAAGKHYLFIADTANHRIRKLDAATNAMTTVAGTGEEGFGGDNKVATLAKLSNPAGVFADTAGNFYIADSGNNRIRKVAVVNGKIDTVVGKGTAGYSGDGGPPLKAELNNPRNISQDAAGNFYIADSGNHCIRKLIAISQSITTIAGTGVAGYSGDGGPSTSAKLNNPVSVSVDAAGNLTIADSGNNCIRKVDAASQTITTIAGTGVAGYSGDGGPATGATLNAPGDALQDAGGNVTIADTGNHALRVVSAYDGKIRTIAGLYPANGGFNGDAIPAATAKLNAPGGIALTGSRGGGRIYISDTANNRIRIMKLKNLKELH
ncbi:MAG: hypothetical protein HY742_03995 [Deltaproteobacteria bacterium]|nr:hypothetical protein [Deltaproteobacteria bacterium]